MSTARLAMLGLVCKISPSDCCGRRNIEITASLLQAHTRADAPAGRGQNFVQILGFFFPPKKKAKKQLMDISDGRLLLDAVADLPRPARANLKIDLAETAATRQFSTCRQPTRHAPLRPADRR